MSQQCSEWSLVEKMLRCEARLWKDCCKSTSASEGEVLTGEGWGGALSPFPFPFSLSPFPFPVAPPTTSVSPSAFSTPGAPAHTTAHYHWRTVAPTPSKASNSVVVPFPVGRLRALRDNQAPRAIRFPGLCRLPRCPEGSRNLRHRTGPLRSRGTGRRSVTRHVIPTDRCYDRHRNRPKRQPLCRVCIR